MKPFRTIEVSKPGYAAEATTFVTVASEALGRRADILLYDAQSTVPNVPVIHLLHGVYGSHWAWMFSGGVHQVYERLRREESLAPFVLAMPSDGLHGDGSGYLNRHCGRFEDWIAHEVPEAVAHVLPSVTSQSRHYITGLSMGGYGAIRIGACHANRFKAISAHSPITTIADFDHFTAERPDSDLIDIATDTDLAHLLCNGTTATSLPPLRFDCGRADILIESNRRLSAALADANVAHHFDEAQGDHDWPYWTRQIADTLRFFDRVERSHRPSGAANKERG